MHSNICLDLQAHLHFLTLLLPFLPSKRWNEIQASNLDWFDIIQPGLEKLKAYEEELMKTPAYIVAMGKHSKIMPSLALGSYDFPCCNG